MRTKKVLVAMAGALALPSAFRLDDHKAQPPTLPDTSGPLTLSRYEAANLPAPTFPGTNQRPPHQEPGHRPQTPKHH